MKGSTTKRGYRVGADIGGTFTDTVYIDGETGRIASIKTPTTPDAPEVGVMNGVRTAISTQEAEPSDCNWFAHGQTIGLNAILTRKGASVGVLATEGFGDLLEVGRGRLPDPFDFNTQRTAPLVRRHFVRTVRERIDSRGDVLTPLDLGALKAASEELRAAGVTSIVVAFMNSYANAVHEVTACDQLKEWFPELSVIGSAELWPQAREYERTMVAVMNEYIGSNLQRYLARLDDQLAADGVDTPILVCSSNGGVIPASSASERPVLTLLSGPAAGVVAARQLQEASKLGGVVTFDMGGTSADMAVLAHEELPYAVERDIDGLPVILPSLDVTSIGAGGGSIAEVDSLGVLKVGPQSAGATPGPACYGLGGQAATVTDAYLTLGILAPESFGASATGLQADLAQQVIARIADRLGVDEPTAAEGVLRVATANLAREFTRLSARQGIDAREFTLLAFGGAGPTQACFLADEMGIGKVAFPRTPGTFCALGALGADFRMDYVKTFYEDLDGVDGSEIDAWYDEIEKTGSQALSGGADFIQGMRVERSADVRFHLQGYDLNVPFDSAVNIDERFRRKYYEIYGHLDEDTPLDLVNLKATVVGEVSQPTFERIESAAHGTQAASVGTRRVYLSGQWREVPVFEREALRAHEQITGPAIVLQHDTTCLVTDGWIGRTDEIGTLVLEREDAK